MSGYGTGPFGSAPYGYTGNQVFTPAGPVTNFRWYWEDPVTGATWYMTKNPKQMTSPIPGGQTVQSMGNRILVKPQLTTWSFSGHVRSKAEIDVIKSWCDKDYPVFVTDHFARRFQIFVTNLDRDLLRPTQRTPYLANYTATAYVLSQG